MAKWHQMPPTLKVTQREYRANIDGINIVFGAVLGFVLAGVEGLPPLDFMLVLLLSATTVVLILYLGSSDYLLFYAVSTAITIAALPLILDRLIGTQSIPYLQPTLAVWGIMVLVVELLPRERAEKLEERDS